MIVTGRGPRIEYTCSGCGRVRFLRLVIVPIPGPIPWRPLVICHECERALK